MKNGRDHTEFLSSKYLNNQIHDNDNKTKTPSREYRIAGKFLEETLILLSFQNIIVKLKIMKNEPLLFCEDDIRDRSAKDYNTK